MKNKAFVMLAGLGVTLLTFLAQTTASSACWWGVYQPKEPKALREE